MDAVPEHPPPAQEGLRAPAMQAQHVRIATCNVDGLSHKRDEVLNLLKSHEIDVMCMQKDKVPVDALPALTDFFSDNGFVVYRALPCFDKRGNTMGGLTIVSKWPMTQEELPPGIGQEGRVLFTRLHRPSMPCVRLAGVHLDAKSAPERQALLQQIIQHLSGVGGDFIVVGDYNCEQDEAPVAAYMANGRLFSIETQEELDVPTRPSGRRHIDYALTTSQVRLQNRRQYPGVSDHDLVCYDLPVEELEPTLRWPLKVTLDVKERRTDAEWADHFAAQRADYELAVSRADTQEAWHIVAGSSEEFLRADGDGKDVFDPGCGYETKRICAWWNHVEPEVGRLGYGDVVQIDGRSRKREKLNVGDESVRPGARFRRLNRVERWNAMF